MILCEKYKMEVLTGGWSALIRTTIVPSGRPVAYSWHMKSGRKQKKRIRRFENELG